jgi:polysaccharide export outer membrane protein
MMSARMLRQMALALMVLIGLTAPEMRAQFTGTTPTTSPGLNVRRPLTTDPAILYPKNRELRLMQGDLLQVSVFGVTPPYSDTERIALDGTIHLPLIGMISLEGLSLTEAEKALARRFEERQIFVDAQVSVSVSEAPGHQIVFIGEVKGVTPITGSKRLYDALASVGGLPPTASTVISIDRPGSPEPIVIDLGNDPARSDAANIPVFAGDTVTTGNVGEAYIVGAVQRPGRIALSGSSPMTVMKAISASGSTVFAAKADSTIIVRTIGDTRTVVKVPLKEVLKGKAPDPVLESQDILIVPNSAIKKLISSGTLLSTVAFAISLASVFR